MSIPQQPIQDLFVPVTPIRYPNDDGHATGFFYRHNGSDYLVTNQHVLADENNAPIADSIRITLRDTPEDLRLKIQKDIPLVENGEEVWQTLDHDPPVDLAAIELSIDLDEYVNIPLDKSSFPSEKRVIGPAEEVIIIGYPIIERDAHLPVIRSGRIASHYGSPFLGNLAFGTDANMHSGTSGSPVFTAPSSHIQTEDGMALVKSPGVSLIGIHSNMIQSPNYDINEGALNLNLAWYSSLIPQILS